LVHVSSNGGQAISTPEYFSFREQAASFGEFGIYAPQTLNVGGDHPECVHSVVCTPGVLRAFGVAPTLGRWLEPSDEQTGTPPVAVISHRLWQQTLAGDPKVIGRTIRLDDSEVTVVGVMPATFEFSSPMMPNVECEIWRPFQLQRGQESQWNWCTLGFLKKGVTLEAANAEVSAIGARLEAAHPETGRKKPFLVTSLRYELTRYGSSYGWMIFGATVLVLMVACVNVASMLLARLTRRQCEFGVRIALGATRSQILRLVLSESILLAVAGTIAGAGLAAAVLRCFKYLGTTTEARRAAIFLDGHALAFAAGLSLIAGLLAGFPAALAALRISVADLLRS
jgi:hypothetical protein